MPQAIQQKPGRYVMPDEAREKGSAPRPALPAKGAERQGLLGHVRVGYQREVQVSSAERRGWHVLVIDAATRQNPQFVDQVFCAGASAL